MADLQKHATLARDDIDVAIATAADSGSSAFRVADDDEGVEVPMGQDDDGSSKSANKEDVLSDTQMGSSASSASSASNVEAEANAGDVSAEKNTEQTDDEVADVGEEKNPWSKQFIGIPVNYFSVGIIYAGSVRLLYPVLVIKEGVTSSFYAAASSLVTLFWSYKIFFGILDDCFPIRGQKWKPYIIIGWTLCAIMLAVLAGMGENITPTNLVIMLTMANLGYVCSNVAVSNVGMSPFLSSSSTFISLMPFVLVAPYS